MTGNVDIKGFLEQGWPGLYDVWVNHEEFLQEKLVTHISSIPI